MSNEQKSLKRPWIVRSRAWVTIVLISPFAALAVLSVPMIREDTLADFVLGAAGWICFFTGATLRWWATLYIGGRKERELAVDGPYSICRNPLYLGSFLLTLSIAFFIHSLTFAVGLAIATPLYLSVTVPWEEKRLLKTFGREFEAYRQCVPKFVPSFSRFRSPATLQVNLMPLLAEYRIGLRWMWIPFLAEAVAHLRSEAWWPALIRLP